jgi:hypothetical protein
MNNIPGGIHLESRPGSFKVNVLKNHNHGNCHKVFSGSDRSRSPGLLYIILSGSLNRRMCLTVPEL